jgi:hypothetical protein
MQFLIRSLTKSLRQSSRTMGRSSFQAVALLLMAAPVFLGLELLFQIVRAWLGRGLSQYDDMRSVQSWNKVPAETGTQTARRRPSWQDPKEEFVRVFGEASQRLATARQEIRIPQIALPQAGWVRRGPLHRPIRPV